MFTTESSPDQLLNRIRCSPNVQRQCPGVLLYWTERDDEFHQSFVAKLLGEDLAIARATEESVPVTVGCTTRSKRFVTPYANAIALARFVFNTHFAQFP